MPATFAFAVAVQSSLIRSNYAIALSLLLFPCWPLHWQWRPVGARSHDRAVVVARATRNTSKGQEFQFSLSLLKHSFQALFSPTWAVCRFYYYLLICAAHRRRGPFWASLWWWQISDFSALHLTSLAQHWHLHTTVLDCHFYSFFALLHRHFIAL